MLAIATMLCLVWSCTPEESSNTAVIDRFDPEPTVAEQPLFRLLREEQTGLDFRNETTQNNNFNLFMYMYFFNGGGLAAEDFNQDGKVDLYFTNNMGENRMYLNEGNMRFQDVTAEAGVEGLPGGWSNGASVVDINNDGLLDIYVSQVGEYQSIQGRNQLFVCQEIKDGVPVYIDEAIPYGLDLVGFGTQAAFFDYDLDGDLDMFQLNHSLHLNGTFGQKHTFEDKQHPRAGDRLFRRDGDTFTEVTIDAGIKSSVIGYGLGVTMTDVNLDGWPDIYVGNDFHENDYLYLNQQDGTFKEVLTEQIKHTSRFSMGVDVADINNDAQPDILSLDMLAEDPTVLKRSLGEDTYKLFRFKLGYGYNHQYSRNTLQLNNGNGTFSEIGRYAGIEATDWSWSALFFDFENDGYRDLFISNGIPRRMNDLDYINYRKSSELTYKETANMLEETDLAVIDSMPRIKLRNKFYHNTGELRFADQRLVIDGNIPSYSTGAIHADLDGDGDLDVVVSNQEDEPFVYQNMTVEQDRAGDYLRFDFEGPDANRHAIGATVVAFCGPEKIWAQHYPVRGFQSSTAYGVNLGIGDRAKVDSVIVVWPDRTYASLTHIQFNATTRLTWTAGLPTFDYRKLQQVSTAPFTFADVSEQSGIAFLHDENPFIDFHREQLMPNMVSAEGPAIAVGDLNGDGLDDVYLGNSKHKLAKLYVQNNNGSFLDASPGLFRMDSLFEDVDAVWMDVEGDGDQDIIVASGGNEFRKGHQTRAQRVYINDGQGQWTVRYDLFPGADVTASCVRVGDFNGDGLPDVFFGARATPWQYMVVPTSLLYQNLGNGKFEEVALENSPALAKAGLVTDAQWADIDGDNDLDLVLTKEWDAVQIFINENGTFQPQVVSDDLGWWNTVAAQDFDGDGDVDILAGNFGENAKLTPSKEEPLRMYVNDYDDNDQREHILTYYLDGEEYPFANYMDLTSQLVSLKKKYLYARDFAVASLDDLFGKEKLSSADLYTANTLSSMYFEQQADGSFKGIPLPAEVQLSTIHTLQPVDLNADGQMEVLVGGNFDECNIEMGRYDASYGHVLRIEQGQWQAYALGTTALRGKVKAYAPITVGERQLFIVGQNDSEAKVLELQ